MATVEPVTKKMWYNMGHLKFVHNSFTLYLQIIMFLLRQIQHLAQSLGGLVWMSIPFKLYQVMSGYGTGWLRHKFLNISVLLVCYLENLRKDDGMSGFSFYSNVIRIPLNMIIEGKHQTTDGCSVCDLLQLSAHNCTVRLYFWFLFTTTDAIHDVMSACISKLGWAVRQLPTRNFWRTNKFHLELGQS